MWEIGYYNVIGNESDSLFFKQFVPIEKRDKNIDNEKRMKMTS